MCRVYARLFFFHVFLKHPVPCKAEKSNGGPEGCIRELAVGEVVPAVVLIPNNPARAVIRDFFDKMIGPEDYPVFTYALELSEVFSSRRPFIPAEKRLIVLRCCKLAPRVIVAPVLAYSVRRINYREVEVFIREVSHPVHAVHIVKTVLKHPPPSRLFRSSDPG